MYRPEWWPTNENGSKGVLEIAQELHMLTVGSAEPDYGLSPFEQEIEFVKCLQWVLDNWVEQGQTEYDLLVKMLLGKAIDDFHAKLRLEGRVDMLASVTS